jgi:hypothetical protein
MNQKPGLQICSYFSRKLTPHNELVVLTNLSGTLRNEFGEDTARAVDIKQEFLNLKSINQFNSRKWKQNQGASVAMAESLGWKLSEMKKLLPNLRKPKM